MCLRVSSTVDVCTACHVIHHFFKYTLRGASLLQKPCFGPCFLIVVLTCGNDITFLHHSLENNTTLRMIVERNVTRPSVKSPVGDGAGEETLGCMTAE